MNDKELADAVVALGVITKDAFRHDMYSLQSTDGQFVGVRYEAKDIVRDWRVAGALMEKVDQIDTQPLISIERGKVEVLDVYSGINSEVENESLPRAIIEACVESHNAK